MILYSFALLSFGNKQEPINNDVNIWMTFALLSMLYWGYKNISNMVDILLGHNEDADSIYNSSKQYGNHNRRKVVRRDMNNSDTTVLSSYDGTNADHTRYMPKVDEKEKKVCDKLKIQNNVTLISVEKN